MATNHKFKPTSASMSVGGFNLVGRFVLNGSVNAEGFVNITPSRTPGEQKAFYNGNLTSPTVDIDFNSVGFDALSQRLRAAHSIEISFSSASDLGSSPTRLDNISISARRKFE
jgi:hypothetical protein